VVAGSVALGFGDDFFDAATDELRLRCGLDFARPTRIEPGGLGADGPLVGAAAVALLHHDRTGAEPTDVDRPGTDGPASVAPTPDSTSDMREDGR
jgi:hypothetical protein